MRSRLTYANVVATLALCLAVGGGSAYAATQLARNSVGSRQIRNHSVALKDLAKSVTGGAGSSGANGLQGPKGDRGPAGATGVAGEPGAAGKDLSFNGVRLGKLDAYTADRGFQFTPEVVLGKAGSADIIARCYLASDSKPHTYITLRRPSGATGGQMVVFGGTDTRGYTTLAPGGTYVLVSDTENPQPEPAYQWAATVAEFDGSVYDVRGLEYRTSNQCFLPQAQVENVSR